MKKIIFTVFTALGIVFKVHSKQAVLKGIMTLDYPFKPSVPPSIKG